MLRTMFGPYIFVTVIISLNSIKNLSHIAKQKTIIFKNSITNEKKK